MQGTGKVNFTVQCELIKIAIKRSGAIFRCY